MGENGGGMGLRGSVLGDLGGWVFGKLRGWVFGEREGCGERFSGGVIIEEA